MDYTHIWKGLEYVHLSCDTQILGDIIKISNIKDHIYVLFSSSNVLHGYLEKNNEKYYLKLNETDIVAVDIASNSEFVYIIERNGSVTMFSEDLSYREEIVFKSEQKLCSHGHKKTGHRIKIKHLHANTFGVLFITDNGQLWARGYMPQIGIYSTDAKRVTFFNGRYVLDAAVGNNFAAVLARKHSQISFENPESDTDECSEDVFVSSCAKCTSTTSSSVSQHSLLSDTCPLGLHLPKSSSDCSSNSEASSAKKSKSYASSPTDSSENSSKQLLFAPENNVVKNVEAVEENDDKTDTTDTEECDEKKNIIFRNTESAREFLTRQFSWMSGGEEYLAECTEGPARIIKQNVSNVASLVYEGVKTVGDKVVTLSRHVSGSSDTNDVLETFETLDDAEDFKQVMSNLNANGKMDEFPWSSSASTSEKDLSDRGVLGRSNLIVKSGNYILNTEVWTWGNVDYGQLGIGDTMKRSKPVLISKLSCAGVKKLTCGNYHCAALTLDGRAFIWGRNNNHQAVIETSADQSGPKQFVGNPNNDRIKDIACGDCHTVLYTYNSKTYYMGKHLNGSTDKLLQLKNGRNHYDVPEDCTNSNRIVANRIISSGMLSCCVMKTQATEDAKTNLNIEQQFLESASLVNSTIIKQFQKKSDTIISVEMNIYETLCRCYADILHFTAANVLSLIAYVENRIPESDITMVQSVEEHISIYKNYLNAICDVISLGGFLHISKLVEVPQQVLTLYSESIPMKKGKKSVDVVLSIVFQHPLTRINIYKSLLLSISRINPSIESKIYESLSKWNTFLEDQEKRRKEADLTKHFWESSGKVVELLRSPERRLIRESRSHPISYLNSGRFSSHWFVLLTDVFVHLNGTSQTIYALPTIWVEPIQDTDTLQNALTLTMPEDSFTLYTTTPQYKNEWLQALQNAIKMSLKKMNALQPPVIRSATYSFQKTSNYKDSKYTGRWCNGKMHGAGELQWPDGRRYRGQFQNNQMNGFGEMVIPNIGVYEGEWKDTLQNGAGIMKYATGDIYEGYFKDGLPHGHGILKQGRFMSNAASVYIGEWACGTKQGYGVMDDISLGQKYLGKWCDNKKQGCGLIVTLDGIYYEGDFNQDTLTGHGIMIFEDGTHYEGELRAAGILNGKGTLTLCSGDKIEGALNGAWNEGVKITNGTLHMKIATASTEHTKPTSFGKLCVAPDQKWKAIFKQCYQILYGGEHAKADAISVTQKVWQNVAVVISNSQQQGGTHRNSSKISSKDENSLKNLDTIPQFGRVNLTQSTFREVKHYLQKAFDCLHHPLGLLLMEVTAAYTATYGGVRVHPLLLSHAVAELHSITSRLYEVVRLLFPALPKLDKELVFSENETNNEVASASSLLHPVLLPRVHSALFVLYALHNKNDDDAYWKRLLKWNKQPDVTLMTFLEIDPKFWPTQISANPPNNPQDIVSPLGDHLYTEAIEHLQQLKTTFSPLEKLFVLHETFQKITAAVQTELGKNYLWSMSDLFPVFYFVVIRASILQLGSEIHFIEDFMEPYLQLNGELGIMFTTLKACYHQILHEKISINN